MFVFVFNFCLFIFWLCWVFVVVQGFSLVVASGGYSLGVQCTGLSLQWLPLCSRGSRVLRLQQLQLTDAKARAQ